MSRKLLSGCWTRRGKAGRLNQKTYMTVTATLFLVVAIMHLLRIILGWQAEIGGLGIPCWVCGGGFFGAGALQYLGLAATGCRLPGATNRSTTPLPLGAGGSRVRRRQGKRSP